MDVSRASALADALVAAQDASRTLPPISASDPSFGVDDAYEVLFEIHRTRIAQGWAPAGRKIGFTNRSLWAPYGVDRPMWANVWTHTVHHGADAIAIGSFVQPRIEPEVVFGLRGPVPLEGDARDVLDAVEWVAAGFEVVQCPYPGWRFTIADCTAAYGLHAALVVGAPLHLDDAGRDRVAALHDRFEATLSRDNEVVARGRGDAVLDGPPLALQHLARAIAARPGAEPIRSGEIVTTGTLTDAQPLEPGHTWGSDYGELGVAGLELTVTR